MVVKVDVEVVVTEVESAVEVMALLVVAVVVDIHADTNLSLKNRILIFFHLKTP